MTGEISLCPGCGCMTNDILGSDGIYCGKCKTQKTSNKNQEKISEDKGNTSPSLPPRKKRQPAEVGYSGDSLATPDNPQECSRQANVATKEDTNKSVLPADSKYNEQWDSYYDEQKDVWLEKPCRFKDCEFCSNRPTKPSEVTQSD